MPDEHQARFALFVRFPRALEIAQSLAARTPIPISVGRGLWHSTQSLSLEESLEHARMAVVAAMAAGDDDARAR